MFRGLRADEIDVRVGSITAKGATFLLYKDARCDMNILDETFGITGWQRKHEVINGNLYCGIGIWNSNINEWIWKWDCGTESNAEKEKGEASDSFKRAAFNIGIGRELYTAGLIFISCKTKEKKGAKGYELENQYQFSGIKVSDIAYKETENKREITGITIVDKNDNVIFTKGQTQLENQIEKTKSKIITKVQIASLEAALKRTGIKVGQVVKKYNVKNIKELTFDNFVDAMNVLEAYETKQKEEICEAGA